MKIFGEKDDRTVDPASRDDNRISPGNTSHSQTRGFLIRIFHLIINNFLNSHKIVTTAVVHVLAQMFGKNSGGRIQIKSFANEGHS